jgi:Domain of unknown function (DUF4274)
MAGDADERDYHGELINWLRDKGEDVWFDSVGHINWDEGVPVLMWLVDQPQCTWPLAASIFWAAAPDFYAAKMLEGETFDEVVDESYALILRIVKNWRPGSTLLAVSLLRGPAAASIGPCWPAIPAAAIRSTSLRAYTRVSRGGCHGCPLR